MLCVRYNSNNNHDVNAVGTYVCSIVDSAVGTYVCSIVDSTVGTCGRFIVDEPRHTFKHIIKSILPDAKNMSFHL